MDREATPPASWDARALKQRRGLHRPSGDDDAVGQHPLAGVTLDPAHGARGDVQPMHPCVRSDVTARVQRVVEVGALHRVQGRSAAPVGACPSRHVEAGPAEPLGAPAQHLGRRRQRTRRVRHPQSLLHDLVPRREALRSQRLDVEAFRPLGQHRGVGSVVEARVDLAAPAHTARLGVGDRRPSERDGEPVVAIHAAHLGQGVRLDVPGSIRSPSSSTRTFSPRRAHSRAVTAPPGPDPTTTTS